MYGNLDFLKFDEELTKQFDFFEVSEIKSLIEMYGKELSKLESIDKVYQEFKLKPSLIVQDILKLNEYLDNWNKFKTAMPFAKNIGNVLNTLYISQF